jgi:hypothetical protein
MVVIPEDLKIGKSMSLVVIDDDVARNAKDYGWWFLESSRNCRYHATVDLGGGGPGW